MKYTMINATSIHHDYEYRTLRHMRVYLSFHVGYVATTSTLALSIALAIEALPSSSHTS